MSSLEAEDDDIRAEIPALLSVEAQQQNKRQYEPKCRQRWGWRGGEQPPLDGDAVIEFLHGYAWMNETELALQCLFDGDYDVPCSVELLHSARREKLRLKRDQDERIRLQAFERAMARHGKKFHLVKKKLGSKVTTPELVSKFYLWKRSPGYQRWSQRQQNKKSRGAARLTRLRSMDHHKEHCEACFKGGKLLCCDGCERAYHLRCVQPPIMDVPDGDWFCSHCRETAVSRSTSAERPSKANAATPNAPDSGTELETISNSSSCELAAGELPVINHHNSGVDRTGNDKAQTDKQCLEVTYSGVLGMLETAEPKSNDVVESSTDNDDSDGGAASVLLPMSTSKPLKRSNVATRVGESRYSSSSRSLEYLTSPSRPATYTKLTPLKLESVSSDRKRKRHIAAVRSFPQLQNAQVRNLC